MPRCFVLYWSHGNMIHWRRWWQLLNISTFCLLLYPQLTALSTDMILNLICILGQYHSTDYAHFLPRNIYIINQSYCNHGAVVSRQNMHNEILREINRSRVETESGDTRRRTGGEVKGKEANGVGSQQSSAWLGTVHPVLLQSFSPEPHSKKASTRLNWQPRPYKWTRPFRWKTEFGFCACAITFSFHSTFITIVTTFHFRGNCLCEGHRQT